MLNSTSHPSVGPWYAKILTGLAAANELSVPSGDRSAGRDLPEQKPYNTDHGSQEPSPRISLPQEIYTALDPFLSLPGNVTRYERSRIQICKLHDSLYQGDPNIQDLSVVSEWFGSVNETIPSPTCVHSIAAAMHSSVGRQWMCILAEESLSHEIRTGARPSQQLILQKQKGYKDLNMAIQARGTRFEEVVLGMSMIAPELLTFGSEAQRNLHVTATDLVLRSKETMKDALKALPHMAPWFITVQYAFGKYRFGDRIELDRIKHLWKADLLGILYATRPSFTDQRQVWDIEQDADDCQLLQRELTNYVVELGRELESDQVFPQAVQMSILLELAWTMIQFADSPTMTRYLHQRVKFLTNRVVLTRQPGQTSNVFRGATVAPALSRARRDTIAAQCPGELLDSDAEICEIIIPALKMFMYLEPRGRQMVNERLSLWLMNEQVGPDIPLLTENEVLLLDDQIVRTWNLTRRDPTTWGPS